MHFAGFSLLAILFCGLLLLALYSRREWVKTFFRNGWLRRCPRSTRCTPTGTIYHPTST